MDVETPTQEQMVAQRRNGKTSREAMSWPGTGKHAAFSGTSGPHSWRFGYG